MSKPKLSKSVIGIAVFAILLAAAAAFFSVRTLSDPYDGHAAPGVSVGGLNLGGMTKAQASQVLEDAGRQLLGSQLEIVLPEGSVVLEPTQMQLQIDTKDIIRDAFRISRKNQTDRFSLQLLDYLTVDETYILDTIREYGRKFDTDYAPSTWEVTGTAPELSTKSCTEETEGQTLVITMGYPDCHVNAEALLDKVLEELNNAFGEILAGQYGVESEVLPDTVPEIPDIDAIYAQLCVEPVSDQLNRETYQLIPGSFGYRFDLEAAADALETAAYGDTLSFPIICVAPEVWGQDTYFQEVLGSCETPHTKNENRTTNLILVCKALDGFILNPGEEFSYNSVVGERTEERGYLPAPAYSGDKMTDSVGGGVCQGSTTLYNCVLLADLDVLERSCHGALVNYVDYGLDAAVSWGITDFRFKNNFNFPIMIRAEVSDGFMRMQILGVDEKDYYIEMTTGLWWDQEDSNILHAASRKCKYDKETGELISRDIEAYSVYDITIR